MKKFLLSLATMLCAGAFASADEVSIPLNSSTGFTGDANSYTATTNGFTLKIDKADAQNNLVAPNTEARIYKGATFTVTGNNGETITKMVITSTGPKYSGFNAASIGSGSWSGTTYTWTGSANSVTLTSGSAQTRAKSIVISYTPAGGVVVAAPTFSPAGGKYTEAQTVTLTSEGNTIYYTIDGANPTDDTSDGSTIKYTDPITVDKTTTIKAIAFDANDNKSSISSQTYEIIEAIAGAEGDGTEANPYNAIAAINAANLGSTAEVYVKGKIASVASFNSKYGSISYYISADGTETNQLYIYGGLGLGAKQFAAQTDLKAGDEVVVKGKLDIYEETPQIGVNSELISLNGETYTPDPVETEGEGTETKPYTVKDVLSFEAATYPADAVWVEGYIVGSFVNNKVSFGTTGAAASNIAIAPTADCEDAALCIPVELKSGSDARNKLNLSTNPANLKAKVSVEGNIVKYFGQNGVKNLTSFKLDAAGVEGIEIDENAPVEYYNLQGVRVENPANGLYIMRQGDKVVKVIK